MENLSRSDAHNDGDECFERSESDDEETQRKPARVGSKTASHRLGLADTIERNIEALNASKLDSEFVTDPMFQKMSQAFDEGGAKGLLMNNLVRIAFSVVYQII